MRNKHWAGTHLWKLDIIYEFFIIKSINNALRNESSDEDE